MPSLPPCLEPTCERSDVVLEGERNECFVFRCRTCKGINIWPFEKEEKRGRYHAYLEQLAREQAEEQARERRTAYSFVGGRP